MNKNPPSIKPNLHQGLLMRKIFISLWSLSIAGIIIRLLCASPTIGSYDQDIDTFIYLGSQLLKGKLMYIHNFDPKLPTVQYIFGPIALFKSITAHRWIAFFYNVIGAICVYLGIKNLSNSDLLPKARNYGLAAAGAGTLFILLSQKIIGGLSGHIHTYSNTFLAIAFLCITLAERSQSAGKKNITLPQIKWKYNFYWLLAGATTSIAISIRPNLIFPCLFSGIIIAILHSYQAKSLPIKTNLFFIIGSLLASIAIFFPYFFINDGLSIAWHGAIIAPAEWISSDNKPNPSFLEAFQWIMNARAGGVSGWMLSIAALPGLLLAISRQAFRPSYLNYRRIILPITIVIYILGLAYSLTHKNLWWHYQLMGALPLTIIAVTGLIHLNSSSDKRLYRLSAIFTLILSMILAYDIFVVEARDFVSSQNSITSKSSDQTVIKDLDKVLTFLKKLPVEDRQFTSPANFRLHWETGVSSTTTGAHPQWSLSAYDMKGSKTTQILQLATTEKIACSQLTNSINNYLILDEFNPKAVTRELFENCLQKSDLQWVEITSDLNLESYKVRVYKQALK